MSLKSVASDKAKPNAASRAQDLAAGGAERRLMRSRSGDVVTVSVVLKSSPPLHRASLRFRSGGVMVTRPLGVFEANATADALKQAWDKLRGAERIAESNGWSWLHP